MPISLFETPDRSIMHDGIFSFSQNAIIAPLILPTVIPMNRRHPKAKHLGQLGHIAGKIDRRFLTSAGCPRREPPSSRAMKARIISQQSIFPVWPKNRNRTFPREWPTKSKNRRFWR